MKNSRIKVACDYHYGISIIQAINSSLKFKTSALYSSKSQRGIAIIAARIKVKQGTEAITNQTALGKNRYRRGTGVIMLQNWPALYTRSRD